MPTVLVVDDSPIDRRLAAGLLEGHHEIRFAENGSSAIASLKETQPDVILTDLQMPDMDGLELVTNVRLNHPDVPIIIMTAHGSEATAVQALETGAASYVPKSQMNVRLLSTIDEILDLARCDHSYSRLIQCSTRSVFNYELENDEELIGPLVELTQQMVYAMGICDATGRLRSGMALEQAILNAIYHGNLELPPAEMAAAREALAAGKDNIISKRAQEPPYSERRVFVEIAVSRDEACFIVRDEGKGFDVAAVTQEEEAIVGEGGRGLVLMRSFMDDVTFNEAGNEVLLVKRRSADAASQANL